MRERETGKKKNTEEDRDKMSATRKKPAVKYQIKGIPLSEF